MNEYKGIPYARMHAHGYPLTTRRVKGGPLIRMCVK